MVQSIDDARRRQRSGPGRVPPHNLEAEQSLLGAMLLSRDAIAAAVAEALRRADLLDAVGGTAALISLQAGTPATTNAARYARIVEEHALLRRLISVAGDMAEMSYELPADVPAAL